MARNGWRGGASAGRSWLARFAGIALLAGVVAFVASIAPRARADQAPQPAIVAATPASSAATPNPSRTNQPNEADAPGTVMHDVAGPDPSVASGPPPIAIPADFGTVAAGPITIRFAPGLHGPAKRLSQQTQKIRKEHSALLGRPTLTEPVTVIVARDGGEMRELAPVGAPPPRYAQGVAYPGWRLIYLSQAPVQGAGMPNLLEVYSHELSHLALRDALGAGAVPRWFNEGFSVYASGEAQVARLETLWLATVGGTLLSLKELEHGIPADRSALAYAQSADVVRYLIGRGDRHRFDLLIDGIARGRGFEASLQNAHGISLGELEREWVEHAESRFTVWPLILGSGTFWVLTVGLFGLAWWHRKRRNRAVLERWAQDEERERQRQIAQQLRLIRTRPQWLSVNSTWPDPAQRRFRMLN